MEIRLLDKNADYNILFKWWKERDHVIIPKSMLSDYGFLVSKDNTPVACMFLYPVVSCDWCMIRFPISDKNATKEIRNEAMNFLFENMFKLAKDMGYKRVFCTTNNPALEKRLEEFNFININEKCDHFWGEL